MLGITLLMAGVSVVLMLLPIPAGLTPAGQRVLAVAFLAIGLWCTDAIPAAVTGIVVVISLTLSPKEIQTLIMTLAVYLVVLLVALSYWAAVGEPLRLIPR